MHGEHNQSMSEGLTFGGKEEALEICKAINKKKIKNQKSKIKIKIKMYAKIHSDDMLWNRCITKVIYCEISCKSDCL